MANVFISYRREEAPGVAGRLYDHLEQQPGVDKIFMDVDALQPGLDFIEQINNAVTESDVLLVLIGKEWLALKDASGRRRLDGSADFVRMEIAAALARGIPVIPVLMENAAPPPREELPENIASLARRHALNLRSDSFRYDAGRIASAISTSVSASPDVRGSNAPEASSGRADFDGSATRDRPSASRRDESTGGTSGATSGAFAWLMPTRTVSPRLKRTIVWLARTQSTLVTMLLITLVVSWGWARDRSIGDAGELLVIAGTPLLVGVLASSALLLVFSIMIRFRGAWLVTCLVTSQLVVLVVPILDAPGLVAGARRLLIARLDSTGLFALLMVILCLLLWINCGLASRIKATDSSHRPQTLDRPNDDP